MKIGILIVIAFFYQYQKQTFHKNIFYLFIVSGFIFSLLGDAVLILSSQNYNIISFFSHQAAHILYIISSSCIFSFNKKVANMFALLVVSVFVMLPYASEELNNKFNKNEITIRNFIENILLSLIFIISFTKKICKFLINYQYYFLFYFLKVMKTKYHNYMELIYEFILFFAFLYFVHKIWEI